MNRAKIEVRPLELKELNLVPRLWTRAGLPFRPKGRDSLLRLRKQWQAASDLLLGAFLAGRLVGVAIASDDGRKGWINRLAVLPEVRRRGVATMLIRECEKALERRGHKLFCVLIEKYNEESMRLFERAGYRREDDIIYYTKRDVKSY